MAIIVQKYGGSSVADKEKLNIVCDKILSYIKRKQKLVIVVSAQGKLTDKLTATAFEYSNNPSSEDLDMLLSLGELKTVSLLCMMLKDRNIKCIGLSGSNAGIITDSNFGSAKIEYIYPDHILDLLDNDYVVVVAGFQGADRLGNITTLGRGGSDLTAVAIAAAIKAKVCEIYTDVDGVFSSDPRIIKKAKLLKNISYEEMLEAATSGAKVMHNRSIAVAKNNNLKIKVNNVINSKNSTSITNKNEALVEDFNISFISTLDNMTKVSIIGNMLMQNFNILATIFEVSKDLNIIVHMVSINEITINLLIEKKDSTKFVEELNKHLIL